MSMRRILRMPSRFNSTHRQQHGTHITPSAACLSIHIALSRVGTSYTIQHRVQGSAEPQRTLPHLTSMAPAVRSTTASGSAVYESERAVHEYLQFHYGEPSAVVPYSFAPLDALQFLPRTVERCAKLTPDGQHGRALDIGCAVGRASFELSKFYDETVGIDFSQHFVDAAKQMKQRGEMQYEAHIQGDIHEVRHAKLPEGSKPASVVFQQGDACNLPPSLGKFDAVFASNLLCRLPEPQKFLVEIGGFINSGGILALVSPYSWLEEYTAKDKWIGGVRDGEGKPVDSFSVIEKLLSVDFELVERQDYLFMIREHERKFQWGVSDGTFWQRK